MTTLRVLSATLFSPRGGSAHVARALASGLRAHGVTVTLVAGSRRGLGDARAFYGDHVRAVAFDAALACEDPMRWQSMPMHPSFEDRPGAPDRIFASLDDAEYELQVGAWSRELAAAGAAEADVLHLHHLTPLNEAAARVAGHVPVVGQLHGTELLMLEQIARQPDAWAYGERWACRLRRWARACASIVVAPGSRERAGALLDVPDERIVELPNGVDVERFAPRPVDREALWRRVLIEQPRGWLPGQPPGSVRYRDADVVELAAGTVLLYVGRFTAVKRLDRLIEAFGAVASPSAGLVVVGGHPGEWEGEHPAQVADRLGVARVYLAGWYGHDELPDLFAGADALALTSEREQFGQVLVEAMASGLAVVATRSFGPSTIVQDGATGWLVHDSGLEAALREVIDDDTQRARRGRLARETACARYSSAQVSQQMAELLRDVAAAGSGAPRAWRRERAGATTLI